MPRYFRGTYRTQVMMMMAAAEIFCSSGKARQPACCKGQSNSLQNAKLHGSIDHHKDGKLHKHLSSETSLCLNRGWIQTQGSHGSHLLGSPRRHFFLDFSGSFSRKDFAGELHLDKCLSSVKSAMLLLQVRIFWKTQILVWKNILLCHAIRRTHQEASVDLGCIWKHFLCFAEMSSAI